MKNIALVIAGGTGERTHQDIPKQFINIHNKPVIVYTLEAFQRHPNIDAIEVVCLSGWQDILRAYAKQFSIAKLEGIVPGGETGMQSIRNGLWDLDQRYRDPKDIVLIHDAIRPMVSEEIISDNIRVCRSKGNAITVVPCTSVMLKTLDSVTSDSQIPRDNLKVTQTPQTFFLREIIEAHKEAISRGIDDSIASCSLYVELGKELYLSIGSEKNIKLTTSEDIEILSALLETKRMEWLKS